MGDNRVFAERWFFYQDTASLWKWAKLDVFGTVLAHSGSSFASRETCVDHARAAGYVDEPIGCTGLAAFPGYVSLHSRAQSPQR